MLPGSGSYPEWKGLGFGTEGASGFRFLPPVQGFRVWNLEWKGLGFGMEDASGSRFLARVGGFRIWHGRCFRVQVGELKKNRKLVLTSSGSYSGWKRLGWEWKVLPGSGSYPGWKGLRFGTEGAPGCRFLPRVEGFRVWNLDSFSGWKGFTPGGRV